jgi:hypothetical protein
VQFGEVFFCAIIEPFNKEKTSMCTVRIPNLRRSSPALEQRAAAIVADFCKKHHLRFSQLRLSEHGGDLRIEYNLHINGRLQTEDAGRYAQDLERRLVFLMSESCGATIVVKWALDWGYAKVERFHQNSSSNEAGVALNGV